MILGVSVMANQVSQPIVQNPAVDISDQEEQSSSSQDDEKSYRLQSKLAITSLTTINLQHELYQIREIILNDVSDPHEVHIVAGLSKENNFRTLFRPVISPNAP